MVSRRVRDAESCRFDPGQPDRETVSGRLAQRQSTGPTRQQRGFDSLSAHLSRQRLAVAVRVPPLALRHGRPTSVESPRPERGG